MCFASLLHALLVANGPRLQLSGFWSLLEPHFSRPCFSERPGHRRNMYQKLAS